MLVICIILLSILLAAVAAYFIMRKLGLAQNIFGNSITAKVEKKKRLEGEVEVLKKKQKVECETIINTYATKEQMEMDSITAQINGYQAQIASLKTSKENIKKVLNEQKKVELDKAVNEFDMKIVSKQNQIKRLGRYIKAEQENIQDVVDPSLPNAPSQKVLLEEKKKK